jgi:hypothetical protein
MADTPRHTEISDAIGRSWCAAEGSGLADGMRPDNPLIRGLTDAVATGILQAAEGIPVRGVVFWNTHGFRFWRGCLSVSADGSTVEWPAGSGASCVVCLTVCETGGACFIASEVSEGASGSLTPYAADDSEVVALLALAF